MSLIIECVGEAAVTAFDEYLTAEGYLTDPEDHWIVVFVAGLPAAQMIVDAAVARRWVTPNAARAAIAGFHGRRVDDCDS